MNQHEQLLRELTIEGKAYRILNRAAEAGACCPSNVDLMLDLNFASSSSALRIVRKLEASGAIAVDRHRHGRSVRIRATGCATTMNGSGKRNGGAGNIAEDRGPHAESRQSHRPPDRTPCFRCNTRADIGCRHRPPSEAL